MTALIKKEIAELSAEITKHQHAYYVKDDPLITDSEYDSMFRRLEDLEAQYPKYAKKDSPTKSVGGKPASYLPEVKHIQHMLSLGNSLNATDTAAFVSKICKSINRTTDKVFLAGEPKYDGLSCANIYTYGVLTQSVTRGDGESGEDVTAQVKTVSNIPHIIPALRNVERYEVRGEVLMLKASFKLLNERQAAAGLKLFANPRNAAAGALRNSDPEITRSRGLHFFAYCLGKCSDAPEYECSTQTEMLALFRSFGFKTGDDIVLITANEIESHFNSMAAKRASLPYEIDGVVFKVDSLTLQEQLGWKSRTPEWATAYKFPPDQATTILEAIDIQVGRTGAQTPVARLRPVSCGGVTVTNVTLHNADEIARKDIRVGDTVIIVRNGDVIPGVASVVMDKRPSTAVPFKMPHTCPSCGGATTKELDAAGTFCSAGLKCTAQRLGAISHYVSRKALDIDGLGDSTIEALLDAGLITTMSDLYSLNENQILALPGFGKRSAELLVRGVHEIKNPELRKFIFALGIPNTGEGTSKRLASYFGSFMNLMLASKTEIESVDDIGPTTANSIYSYLHDAVTGAEAMKLFGILQPKEVIVVDNTKLKLGGKTFVVTGTLSVSRDKIHALIEENGGIINGSVNKKLDYLVAGDAAGSKLDKANTLKITVLTETEFRALIE